MKSANIRYLPGLDHLRALAALHIVFYHGLMVFSFIPRNATRDMRPLWILPRNPFVVFLEEGHTAVAMFMALSGFVFTIGAQGKDIEYWPFIKNRLLRIYPLFVVVLLAGIAAFPGAYSFLGVMQSLLLQANLPGSTTVPPFGSMFWAVAVEFQFYLAFPFMHRFLERDGVKWGLGLIVLATALRVLAVKCAGASNGRDIAYWHILGRIDQFMLGMLAARVYERIKHRELAWGLLSLGSFVLVLATLVGFSMRGGWDSVEPWRIYWPTFEALAWSCFIVSYVGFAQRHTGRWSWVLEQIGSFSYSIYLLHFAVLTALPNLIPLGVSSSPDRAALLYTLRVVLPVLLTLAALSYYVIERPFLALRVKYLRERDDGGARPSRPMHLVEEAPVRDLIAKGQG